MPFKFGYVVVVFVVVALLREKRFWYKIGLETRYKIKLINLDHLPKLKYLGSLIRNSVHN